MKTLSLEDFKAAIKAQGMPSMEHYAFICPMCETVQSGHDLIAAGAGDNFDAVEKFLGFSCVGRFTGQEFTQESKGAGRGCNWTLGGLFKTHQLEVVTPDGEHHPRFEVATLEQAQAHLLKNQGAM